MKSWPFLISLLVAVLIRQQPPPATEIYIANLATDAMPVATGPVVNISNNPGYDNQPSFLPDGSAILFSSQRDGKQMDIFRYDRASKAVTQLTRTPESEYSPLVTPDRKSFSVIRVEADGAQRLWRFDLDGTNPRLVLENVKPVGYHVWIDQTHLALFILGGSGQPSTLQLAETATGVTEIIDSRIGRSLLLRPGAATVTYVSQPENAHWVIKEFDPRTKATTTLTDTVDANMSQDFVWHSHNWLLMASGTKIFGWTSDKGWTEQGDFSSAGIGRITRLAVAPSGASQPALALVAEPRPQ